MGLIISANICRLLVAQLPLWNRRPPSILILPPLWISMPKQGTHLQGSIVLVSSDCLSDRSEPGPLYPQLRTRLRHADTQGALLPLSAGAAFEIRRDR